MVMVSWGRYKKERFVEREEQPEASVQTFAASSLLPVFTREDEESGMQRPDILSNW